MSACQAVLFDLDGTLADTALDLGAALNRLLAAHQLPSVAMDRIRPVASHGASGLLALGAGIQKEHPQHAQWRQDFLDEYDKAFAKDTVLFDGVNDTIRALHERGLAWGIITNKPKRFTDRLVPQLPFDVPPQVVVSGDTTAQAKPSVLPMFYAAENLGVSPAQCLYVGDAERDMQAGRQAGMTTVLARWGYIGPHDKTDTWPVDHEIASPCELLPLLHACRF